MSLMLFGILSASPNQCIDIYNDCYDANPYDEETQAFYYLGNVNGCKASKKVCSELQVNQVSMNQIYSFFSKVILSTVTVLLFNCIDTHKNNFTNNFDKYVFDLPSIKVDKFDIYINDESINTIHSNINNTVSDKIFFIDHSNWTLYMAKKDGTILDRAGGIGRGPGEFSVINDLHVYEEDKVLQVLDKRSKRFTYYNFEADSLEFLHTISLPNYGGLRLQNLYGIKGMHVGVFHQLEQSGGDVSKNRVKVFSLNNSFTTKEEFFDVEGSELIETQLNGNKFFTENLFGNETVWNFSDGKLFFGNAENLNFKVISIENREISEINIPEIPDNLNNQLATEYVLSKYSMFFTQYPEYEKYFKERKFLPFYSSIYARGDFLYIPLTKYRNEKSFILRYNLELEQMEKIETPSNFFMKGVNDNGIYGITVEDDSGELNVSILEFN
ncbi:MAG: 6-bladed beta-propeller [Balneola sp.]|nr:MAG: 6-bladed beta-propeller [Balneola sp.]